MPLAWNFHFGSQASSSPMWKTAAASCRVFHKAPGPPSRVRTSPAPRASGLSRGPNLPTQLDHRRRSGHGTVRGAGGSRGIPIQYPGAQRIRRRQPGGDEGERIVDAAQRLPDGAVSDASTHLYLTRRALAETKAAKAASNPRAWMRAGGCTGISVNSR